MSKRSGLSLISESGPGTAAHLCRLWLLPGHEVFTNPLSQTFQIVIGSRDSDIMSEQPNKARFVDTVGFYREEEAISCPELRSVISGPLEERSCRRSG
jgi:hypothetical protein